MPLRLDIARFDNVERTPQGGIRVRGNLSRTGVLEYADADGSVRREYRPPEEVFAPASLATLRGATVTDLHPAGVVHKDNWKDLSIGHVGDDVKRDGEFVSAPVVIQDGAAVERVLKGERKELSVGYEVEIDPTPGVTPEGERYDAIQRNIRANHVGVGPEGWGRSGSQVALRLDGASVQVMRADGPAPKGTDMKTFKVGSKQFRRDDDAEMVKAQDDVDALQKKADDNSAELAAIKDALTQALTKIMMLEAKQSAAPSDDDVTDDDVTPEVYDSITRTRALGAKLLGKDSTELNQKPSAIRAAVVKKIIGADLKLDGLPEATRVAHIDGMFVGIAKMHEGRNDSLGNVNRLANDPRLDAEDPVAAAQKRRAEKNANAWKQKKAS